MKETLTKTRVPEIAAEPEASERAASWLEGLAARGVTVTIRNNRLCLHPGSAHRTLTDDEVLTLRHHRAEIKAVINAGVSFDVVRAAPTAEKVTPAPAPPLVPCKFCNQPPAACAELKTTGLDVWRTLHALDPDEIDRKNAEATAEMRLMVGEGITWHRR